MRVEILKNFLSRVVNLFIVFCSFLHLPSPVHQYKVIGDYSSSPTPAPLSLKIWSGMQRWLFCCFIKCKSISQAWREGRMFLNDLLVLVREWPSATANECGFKTFGVQITQQHIVDNNWFSSFAVFLTCALHSDSWELKGVVSSKNSASYDSTRVYRPHSSYNC